MKKCLKIPKKLSEAVIRRRDNTMANRKGTKGQTTIYKNKTIEISKDRVTRTSLKLRMNSGAPEKCAGPRPYVAFIVLLLLETW